MPWAIASFATVDAAPPNAFPFPDTTLSTPHDSTPVLKTASPAVAESPSYVLLRNDNLLVGRVLPLGELVEVDRGDGSSLRVSAQQIMHVAPSIEALYAYRKSNRIDVDLKAIQNDVRWYLRYGMIRQAAQDALLARALEPRHPETSRLLKQIASRLRNELEQSSPKPADAESAIQTVSHEEPAEETSQPSQNNSGLPDELVYHFQARVQPIFLNRCNNCHTKHESNDRAFQIHPASRARWAPATTARDNIASILEFVDRENPQASVIRVRASDGHGGSNHSFGNERSAMMQRLDHWLNQLSGTSNGDTSQFGQRSPSTNAHSDGTEAFQSNITAPSGSTPASAVLNSPEMRAAQSIPTPTSNPWADQNLQEDSQNLPQNGATNEGVRRMPKVENPFDPSIFNRRFHPE